MTSTAFKNTPTAQGCQERKRDPGEPGTCPLLDDGDTYETIGRNQGGWNVKVIEYPGTGEKEIRYYQHGYTGAQGDREWETVREEDLPPEEREKRDRRNLRRAQRRAKNKIYQLGRANSWEWFVTLTLNPEKVDRYDYDACARKVRNQLIKMRRHYPEMESLVIAERHKDGAYHFHGLFFGIPDEAFTDSGVTTRSGKTVYNLGKYTMGFTTATRVEDSARAANYLAKYITKELLAATPGRKRYWRSDGLQEPVERNILMTGEQQRAYYWGHLEEMQDVKDVRVKHGDFEERIIYAQYRTLTEGEKERQRMKDRERVKAQREWEGRQLGEPLAEHLSDTGGLCRKDAVGRS